MRSWWKVSKHGWAHGRQTSDRHQRIPRHEKCPNSGGDYVEK
jgi:hypothetical protein